MLQTIILTMLIWWIIHFGCYFALKIIIRRASERQIVEMFTAPLVAIFNHRKWKKTESYGFLSFLVLMPFVFFFCKKMFQTLQATLIFGKGLYIPRSTFIFPTLFILVNLFLILYLLGAKYSISKDKNWKHQPTIIQINERIARLKVRFFYNSIFCQMMFILSMFNYVAVDENGIRHNSFYNLTETEITNADIREVEIVIDEWDVIRDGQRVKEYHPYCTIYFKDYPKIELWDNVHFSKKQYDLLKNVVYHLHQNHVFIDLMMPSLFDKSKLKDNLRQDIYNEIMDFFQYAEAVLEERTQAIPLGTPFELDGIIYRMDSTVANYGKGFFSPSKGNRFEHLFLTIENTTADTFILVQMNLKMMDDFENEYATSVLTKDTFETFIPPHTTHSGNIAFQVPDTSQNLKLCYEEGFLNKRIIWFELSENASKKLH